MRTCWNLIVFVLNFFAFRKSERNFITYRHVQMFNSKKCASSEMVFEHVDISEVRCTFKCAIIEDCIGVFYSKSTKTCTGCGHFRVTDLVDAVNDTEYFYNCGETVSWGKFGGSYYKLFPTKAEFDQAKRYCRDYLCGVLLRLDSENEAEFIADMASAAGVSNYLIGLEYDSTDAQWKWIDDKTPPTYTNWASNEPHCGPFDLCVVVKQAVDYQWRDRECTDYHFFCEK